MKPRLGRRRPPAPGAPGQFAFTLTELMVTTAIFLILIGGLVSTHLFGLRMYQLEENKLTASDGARKLVSTLGDEIRSCESFQLGTVSNGLFTALPLGAPQSGSALIVYPTTNTSNYILYFVTGADQKFRRATNAKGSTRIMVSSVTNTSDLFRGQDYRGNLLTNLQDNTVLHVKLEFYQVARLGVPPDYYKLETSATRR